jgi:hypothetical protein
MTALMPGSVRDGERSSFAEATAARIGSDGQPVPAKIRSDRSSRGSLLISAESDALVVHKMNRPEGKADDKLYLPVHKPSHLPTQITASPSTQFHILDKICYQE